MERNIRPNASGYNLTQDHPGYDLPVSNIAYYVYPEDTRAEGEAVAQRAFQRIEDSYDEYEKLTDVFKVEFDRRQQQVNERKQHEKLLKEERLRRQKEDRKNRRLGKPSSSATNCSKTPQQLSSSSLSSYHPYRHASQHASAAISLTDPGRGPSLHRTFSRHGHGYTQGSIFATTSSDSHSHPHLGQDHPPHLIHATSAPGERSPSSSPILPLTPSPQLGTSDAALSSVASASAASFSTSSSASATPFSISGSVSSFAASTCSGAQPQQPQRIRKKRKQAIPVHPSVVDRIPGITLRIQPDAEQHLQVEILKNVDDYRPMRSTIRENEREMDCTVDLDPNDEHMGRISLAHDESSIEINGLQSPTPFQARQDLDKVRESIKSGRPSYSFLSSTYNQQFLERDVHHLPESSSIQDMDTFVTSAASKTSGLHQRQSSSSSGRSLDFYDPTRARSSTVDHPQQSLSTSATSLTWPQQYYDPFGMPLAPEDLEAARAAALPLSWDNFSTRDCQVNKVIGKHDKDFELLEELVQETIARQHAAQLAAEESDDQSQGKPRRRRGSHQQDREGSETSARSTPAATSTKSASGRGSLKANSGSKASLVVTSRTAGTHATRGGATGLVQTYDDIERILKEKRLKKREARKRQESLVADAYHEDEQDHMEQLDQDEEGDGEDQGTPGLKTEDDLEPDDLLDTAPQKQMLSRRRKSLSLFATRNDDGHAKRIPPSKLSSQPTSPPSPPHSRQVTPSMGESTVTSRRSSISSHVRHQTYVNAAPGSDTSGTPPATPTRANAPLPPLFSLPQEESPVSGGRTRMRSRSVSISTPIISMEGKNKNSFFDSALEQIAAKRRQKLAKKKAAAAAAAAAAMKAPEQRNESSYSTQETSEANLEASDAVDPHALERELYSLKSSERVDASKGNLPKSSKFLPGRVLRTTRAKPHDPLYPTDMATGVLGPGMPASVHGVAEWDHRPKDQNATGEDLDVELLDPDCTSCRLALNGFDKQSWKRAREAGEVYLNPKRWGKTAILCIACRLQYQKHHLRCTQCFYVPVTAPDEGHAVASRVGSGPGPKAGGTCSRCKAGTWLREIEN
ncbi:hypothetical protein BGZ58_008935 [Dissophora ornata]|nr:hypothetical protein BGZ58_008935 [Dissophora ornata]